MNVRAKKHLGQHFLADKNICQKIAQQYGYHQECGKILEIGPGMGALTAQLLNLHPAVELMVMDVDPESCAYLQTHFPQLTNKIIHADFLKTDLSHFIGNHSWAIVGNFPYNISSQILFKCLDFRDQIPEIVGMFQKEVAERIAEPPGSKRYGILSVLMQTFYDIRYCFTVNEHVFSPPPKVKSGVIRCTRNNRKKLPCDEALFFQVVKMGFNQRRKTLRNALKTKISSPTFDHELLNLRPEMLTVEQFIELTTAIEEIQNR